jgi:hypothetical protein
VPIKGRYQEPQEIKETKEKITNSSQEYQIQFYKYMFALFPSDWSYILENEEAG